MSIPSLRPHYQSPDAREIMPFPAWEAIVAYLHQVAAALPEMVALEEAGQSVGGRPIWLVLVTDRSVPDDDKQVVLAVAQ
jgi:hypothetical protein